MPRRRRQQGLERCSARRPCQIAKERFGVPKVIARVNDPRNQAHFNLLGITPTVSATSSIIALVEHEVPEHDLIHLLELRKENLEIVEMQIAKGAPSVGKRVEGLALPVGSRLISVMRGGPRSPWARRRSGPATRCSRSWSRARRTSCGACCSSAELRRRRQRRCVDRRFRRLGG